MCDKQELNISKELKENILANPELAIIYANDLSKNENNQQSIFGDENKEFAYDMVRNLVAGFPVGNRLGSGV